MLRLGRVRRFEIKNFKSIKHINITLPDLMVMVGPNGVGKTNILQAMELMGRLLAEGSVRPARELGWSAIARRSATKTAHAVELCVEIESFSRIIIGGDTPADSGDSDLCATLKIKLAHDGLDGVKLGGEELTLHRRASPQHQARLRSNASAEVEMSASTPPATASSPSKSPNTPSTPALSPCSWTR